MITYKLFRVRSGLLYPLFVLSDRPVSMQKWLNAEIGPLADETHVKSRIGKLARRPGWHSTEVPFTDWIGKKGPNGQLYQAADTVWCECEVEGEQLHVTDRYGLRTIPTGWYYYKTQARQKWPWIISDRIFIKRKLSHVEVEQICREHGVDAQPLWAEGGNYGN